VIAEAIDELDREVSVDSGIVRAHQHAAGARKAVPRSRPRGVDDCAGDGELAPENLEFGDRSVRESSGQAKK
jgi:hypothetical protein